MNVQNRTGKHLDRRLGAFSVFSISLGAMMGSGIFVLPLLAATIAGPMVCLSYMLAGILVMPALFSMAELSTAMPIAGGTYVYVDRSMGPLAGTITGLGTWFSLVAKTAFALVGLGAYLTLFSSWNPQLFTLIVLSLLLLLNVVGVGKASLLQKVIVAICLATMVVFGAFGAGSIETAYLDPAFPEGLGGILAGTAFVFVSYAGVTKVCSVAEEIRHPERNLPLGMMAAQFTAMGLYVLVSFVIVGNVDVAALEGQGHGGHGNELLTPVATAAESFWGETGRTLMAIVAIAGLISMCNAGIMSSSRYPFAMARDDLVPRFLRKVSPRFGTPAISVAVTGAVLYVLILSLPVEEIAHLASGFTLFIFCFVNLSVIVLRETNVQWYRPKFRTPLYPWMQLFGILGAAFLLVEIGGATVIACLVCILLASLWYFGYARKHVDRQSAVAHLWDDTRAVQTTGRAEAKERVVREVLGTSIRKAWAQEHRVLVPLLGQERNPGRLIDLAGAFLDEGTLEVLELEEVPDTAALGAMLKVGGSRESLAQATSATAQAFGLQCMCERVVTQNAKHSLLQHAERCHAEWIVMEWPTQGRLASLVRQPMAWWLEHTPCDMALFLDRGAESFERILVMAQPGPYDTLVVHIADRLARHSGGELTFFWPVATATEEKLQHAYHLQLAQLCEAEVDSRVVVTEDRLAEVERVSADFDLLVLGAPQDQGLLGLVRRKQTHIHEVAQCSVLRVKAPRHKVHHRLSIPPGTLEEPHRSFEELIDSAVVVTGVTATRKADLLATMASELSSVADPAALGEVLSRRERIQCTALPDGVQLTAPALPVEKPTLAVFRLSETVRFGGPVYRDVDLCFLLLACRGQRQLQLSLLEHLYRLLQQDDLLRRLRSSGSTEEVRAALRAAIGASAHHCAPRALLVDGGGDFMDTITGALRLRGVHAESASDSIEAVAMLQAERYDAVLIDDGAARPEIEDIVELLRHKGSDATVFVLTDQSARELVSRCDSASAAVEVLTKPVDSDAPPRQWGRTPPARAANG